MDWLHFSVLSLAVPRPRLANVGVPFLCVSKNVLDYNILTRKS